MDKSDTKVHKTKRALSQNQPALLREVRSISQWGKKSSVFGMRDVGSLLRSWAEISRINWMPGLRNMDSLLSTSGRTRSSTRKPSRDYPELERSLHGLEGYIPVERLHTSDEDLLQTFEQFPINVTPLMNEDQHWGCFYTFPELYEDQYSPVVRVRRAEDVPELVGGVLTRDMVTACLTYLKRTPILGDFVYIKLDLSMKHLINIEVLQHYKYLVYLDLSSNLLTELTVLSRLLYLQYLSVAFNRLNTVLEYDVPQWFLTEVHYKYNSVKRIRDLTMFWSITVLDLSHNNIKTISGLDNLFYLRRLDLSFNHIQRLENLNHLRLTWLDVSYNNISSFEFGPNAGLWTLLHLEFLNLNENNLTSMKIFSGCTRLRQVHARNNRLSMLLELAVYMRQMRRLIELDLRANPICNTPGYKDVIFNTFPILVNLDAEVLDPVEMRLSKMDMLPQVSTHATHRLLRLLYIEQLSRAKVSPFVPPADTQEVPLIVIVGYEAVGKGTLARRLAAEFPDHVELATRHTTAITHFPEHYIEVTRGKFDDMLINGDFLTYSEMNGESYGLSREEAFVKDGKAKIATMDLTSALMLHLRGLRPYLILASTTDKRALHDKQLDRKIMLNKLQAERSSIEVPLEKSTLQVLISGRILITGILNEILMTFPEEKEQSEFQVESQCSLLMDSEARQAARDYAREVNMLTLLASGSNSTNGEECHGANADETSLCSLYKESQNTDEYASDVNGQESYQSTHAKKSTTQRPDKSSNISRRKSVDFSRYVSSTWKGDQGDQGTSGMNSSKSSKSVTFTSQDNTENVPAMYPENAMTDPSGLLIEPATAASEKEIGDKAKIRSMSTRLQRPPTSHGDARTSSDVDLWLAFLVETGIMQLSDTAAEPSETITRHETKVDDPDYIINQLTHYSMTPSYNLTRGTRDEYEETHRQNPGMFYDTVSMDDPEEAYKKMKRIVKEIVGTQKTLKPMFDIDFANQEDVYPLVKSRIEIIRNQISPQRFFF